MSLAAGRECRVRAAASGTLALRMLLDEPPSVLVAELELPGLSGERLAARARLLSSPPLVLLVGADHERLSRAARYADHTLRKPFDMAHLERLVAEGCRRELSGVSR